MAETLYQDLAFAVRALRRSPGFTLAAVLTLALGIGANVAIFGVVNTVLLRPLPFPEPERLLSVTSSHPLIPDGSASLPDYLDWREGAPGIDLAAMSRVGYNLAGDGEPERIIGGQVTANFFGTMGVAPALGRGFLMEEETDATRNVVVLSHELWVRRYAADPAIVGQTVTLSERPFTVVGVAPEGFVFPNDVQIWAPMPTESAEGRRANYLAVVGRVKPGVSAERAEEQLNAVAARLAEQYPDSNTDWTVRTMPLQDRIVEDVRPALVVFSFAVGLVLLIACANVANLLLARATAREREIAVRSALGAGRGRLVRQLLTESLVLALLGGAAGLLLAYWSVDALRLAGADLLPRAEEIGIDGSVVIFSLALSVATGLLFGLAPALRLAFGSLHGSLKEGARGATGGVAGRFRSALVLAEVALAVVLLVGAGLLLRSFDKLNRVDPGFDPSGVLTYNIGLPGALYSEPERQLAFYERVLERTRAIPGVGSAALSTTLPTEGTSYLTFAIEGSPDTDDGVLQDVQPFAVSPDYFRTLQIPLLRGRLPDERDGPDATPVVAINDVMAERFFPGEDPIGRRITLGNPEDPDTRWQTIVGIVGTVAQEGLDAAPYPQMYEPIAQAPSRGLWMSIRTGGDPAAVIPTAREALRAVDPAIPFWDALPLEERMAASIAQPRVNVAILGVFAAVALALAAIGIYGVMSYAVTQRTREIGIRMALGASSGTVTRLIVRQGMRPALLGIAVGIVGALLVTRLMASLLYGVGASDPLTFAGVALFLGGTALLASYLPARRATRVDPVDALRAE